MMTNFLSFGVLLSLLIPASLQAQFEARRCINVQTIATLQSQDLLFYSFGLELEGDCQRVNDNFLIYQGFVGDFSMIFPTIADQNCYFLGALDGAFKAYEGGISQCMQLSGEDETPRCDILLADLFEDESIEAEELATFRLSVLELSNPAACLDAFKSRLKGQIEESSDED